MRPRVLLIEDHDGTRATWLTLLELSGFAPVGASTGEEGLRLFSEDIEAVVTDVCLPDTTGLQILEEIRRRSGSVPVVMVTGFASVRSAVSAMQTGATSYLEKPVDYDTLLGVLRSSLRRLDVEKPPDHRTTMASRFSLDLSRAAAIVDQDPHGLLGVAAVAQAVGISTKALRAAFKAEGWTFREFRVVRRVDRTIPLLRLTSKRISEIAYEVGFNDPSYFDRVFRRCVGLSPKEYRKQCRLADGGMDLPV